MALIVVAEDDAGTMRLIEAALRLQGHQILTADNGHSAWSLIQAHRPGLVVSDINMPGLNGFELLKNVREHTGLHQTPFILLTSLQERRDMRQGMTLGADDYLTKPVQPRELTEAVASQLNRKAMRAAAQDLQLKEAVTQALDKQAWALQEQYETRLARELSEQWPGEAQGQRDDFHPQAAVLFAELRNDLAWARVLPPQQLALVLKRFYEGGGDTVHLFGARSAHFVGDGLLAVFTDQAADTTAHHALRAVKAAFGLRKSAIAMNGWLRQQFPGRSLPDFEVGIVIHSGAVAMMRLEGLLGSTAVVLPVGETVVNTLAIERAVTAPNVVTLSIPVLRAVTGAVQPASRQFLTLPQGQAPLEVCTVEPLALA